LKLKSQVLDLKVKVFIAMRTDSIYARWDETHMYKYNCIEIIEYHSNVLAKNNNIFVDALFHS